NAGKAFLLANRLEEAAEAFVKCNELEEAIRLYRRLGKEDTALEVAAQLAFKRAQYEEAARLYLQADDPRMAAKCWIAGNALEKAAKIYEKIGDFKEAGETYLRANEWTQAAVCFQRCKDPLDQSAFYEMAREILETPERVQRFRKKIEELERRGEERLARIPFPQMLEEDRGIQFPQVSSIPLSPPLPTDSESPASLLPEGANIPIPNPSVPVTPKRPTAPPPGTFPSQAHPRKGQRIAEGSTVVQKRSLLRTQPIEPKESLGGIDLEKILSPGEANAHITGEAGITGNTRHRLLNGSQQRYTILSEIGRGGMSKVYLARDNLLDRKVAYKVLSLDFHDNPKTEKLLAKEARSMARLSHQNIVTLFDIGQTGDTFFLVMEYMDGTTVKQLIKERAPLTLKD
ncbi:MAG: hypothetical protein D6795_14280, partial [Deltaproteobacteria bacterium]